MLCISRILWSVNKQHLFTFNHHTQVCHEEKVVPWTRCHLLHNHLNSPTQLICEDRLALKLLKIQNTKIMRSNLGFLVLQGLKVAWQGLTKCPDYLKDLYHIRRQKARSARNTFRSKCQNFKGILIFFLPCKKLFNEKNES